MLELLLPPRTFEITSTGGGTLLHRLAASGKRILVLERGPFLPREKENWNYFGSFKYYSPEVMFNKDGGEIRTKQILPVRFVPLTGDH